MCGNRYADECADRRTTRRTDSFVIKIALLAEREVTHEADANADTRTPRQHGRSHLRMAVQTHSATRLPGVHCKTVAFIFFLFFAFPCFVGSVCFVLRTVVAPLHTRECTLSHNTNNYAISE